MEKEKKLSEEEIQYNVTQVEEEHILGKLLQDDMASQRILEPIKVPIGYKRQVKIDDKDVTAFMCIKTPAEIDPEFYYPAVEWRINPETLDDADFIPQWKRMPVLIGGQPIMEEGRELLISYYVITVQLDMDEESDGRFFLEPPFGRGEIKMSDIGLPMIKGSDIIMLAEAKKTLAGQSTFGASRRRVG